MPALKMAAILLGAQRRAIQRHVGPRCLGPDKPGVLGCRSSTGSLHIFSLLLVLLELRQELACQTLHVDFIIARVPDPQRLV